MLGPVLNFFDRVHTEVLLEEKVGVNWLLSKVATRSSGIGHFSMARYSCWSIQHR